MAVKISLPPVRSATARPLWETALTVAAIVVTFTLLIIGITFSYYSNKYKQVVDERLAKPLFNQTPRIYAAPREVRDGQKLTAEAIAQQLRSAGYVESSDHNASQMGTFTLRGDSIAVHPGQQSYHSQDGATISFENGAVSTISGDAGQQLAAYELEPQLITSLSEGANRVKRRLITYNELPPALVQAVTSIEDRRFFSHGGVDYYSLMGWVYHDLRGDRRYRGGASTLTMQLARGIFLSPARRIKRKLIEIAITFQLEHRYNKQQIFTMYANQVPLGQQGSFGIYGVGEAAQAYFGKDVRQLDLAECALLAGMIQQPSMLNPYRHPTRATSRRNVVLGAMVETGAITQAQADAAKQEPLHLAPGTIDGGLAPYFIDIVHDQIVRSYGETQYSSQGLRVYSSLDPDLQRVANEAVTEGMKGVDALVAKRREKAKDPDSIASPQVALVALNPHTGQILALVGGRNYGISQLNHAIAHRPTGSIFKPFVYAAAFNTSLAGTQLTTPPTTVDAAANGTADSGIVGDPNDQQDGTPAPTDPGLHHGVFTEVSMLNNDLTTFEGGYSPGNYGHAGGQVTARYALQFSLNNATVELAQMVGYGNVAALARDAGIHSAQGTPSVALGSYDATPIDMAGAYTTFANNGTRIVPWEIASVRASNGDPLSDHQADMKPILDPRVAYLTTNMLQNVMNAGTAASVRGRGFQAPAAGKTGTSRDAWFAGYTSNLICIIWIGNDDYSDIKLQGAHAAAPIWAEFMKRAIQLPQYSDTRDFSVPQGVNLVKLDKATNLLADPTCPTDYYAAFLDGTAPTNTCSHPNDDQRNFFQKLFGLGGDHPQQLPSRSGPTVLPPGQPQQPNTPGMQNAQNDGQPQDQQKPKKRGFFGRLFGGGKKDQQQQNPQQ